MLTYINNRIEIAPIIKCLDQPDFFSVTGVAMRVDEHKIKLCGHSMLHTFNLQSSQFESSSPM